MASFIGRLRRFLASLWGGLRPELREIVFFDSHSDVPSVMKPGWVAIVGSKAVHKWAIFTCPCGRGHRIDLNLQARHMPHWRLTIESGLPTVSPSVDYVGEFRCHFFVRRGRVHWVNSAGEMTPSKWSGEQ